MTERSEFNQRVLNSMPPRLMLHILDNMDITKEDTKKFNEFKKDLRKSIDLELTGNTLAHTKNLRMVSYTKGSQLVKWLIKELKDTRRCNLMLVEWTFTLHDAGAINVKESTYEQTLLDIDDLINKMIDKHGLEKQKKSTDKQLLKFHAYAEKIGVL